MCESYCRPAAAVESAALMEAAGALRSLPAQLRARSFEREIERLRPLGEAYVMRRFSGQLSSADAEDAVADVLIRLHRQVEAGRAPRNLRAAFFTGVRNAAIDQLRARAARPTVGLEAVAEAPAASPTPLERAEGHEQALRLQEALGRMRGNYREALVLRFGLGFTVPEIASHLGVSLPAAKKLVLRATGQVRKRLEAIEGEEFCPEMRDLARRSLFDKEASGTASEAEAQVLHAHFEHCGACRSFLSNLHEGLHDLGAGALVAGAGASRFAPQLPGLGHLGHWIGHLTGGVHAGAAKLRFAAFKASGALQPGDAGTAGALAGSGQKIAAICTAGVATTATCLATGIVGPGIGITASPPVHHHRAPAPKVRAAAASSVATEAPLVEAPPPEPEASEPAPQPAPESSSGQGSETGAAASEPPPETPVQQEESEFGVESASGSEASPSSTPAPSAPAAPPPSSGSSSGSSSSSGGGSGGGGESFGFNG